MRRRICIDRGSFSRDDESIEVHQALVLCRSREKGNEAGGHHAAAARRRRHLEYYASERISLRAWSISGWLRWGRRRRGCRPTPLRPTSLCCAERGLCPPQGLSLSRIEKRDPDPGAGTPDRGLPAACASPAWHRRALNGGVGGLCASALMILTIARLARQHRAP